MNIAKILDCDFLHRISFFNFENAITGAFYADQNLNLINTNNNFESLFKTGIELKSQNLLTLLANLGVEQKVLKKKIRNLKKFPIGWQNICHLKFIKIFLKQNLNMRTIINEKN